MMAGGQEVRVEICGVRGGRVRLGCDAREETRIVRTELLGLAGSPRPPAAEAATKAWFAMREPNFVIVEETEDCVLIRDVGPWDQFPTVTNGAEAVVSRLVSRLRGRRLEYLDGDGNRDQLLVKDGAFAGFAPAVSVSR